MDFVLLLKIFLVSWIINSYECENESSFVDKYRDGKSFFFLPPIIPLSSFTKRKRQSSQKQACLGDSGLQGVCASKTDCTSSGGNSSGLCSDTTVCCVNYRTCGSNSSAEWTYFVNPNFPDSYSGGAACKLKVVKSNSQVCQLRIDFKEFNLAQPSSEGYCVNDFFTVSDCLSYKFCGQNKNQHIYVNFNDGSDALTLLIDTNSAEKSSRSWNMEIEQIACNSTSLGTISDPCLKSCNFETNTAYLRLDVCLAPSGCLMYYRSTSGTVRSFNYGELEGDELRRNRQIRGMNYGVCVQWRNEFCSIEWSKAADPYSFSVSGNSSLLNDKQVTNYLGVQGQSCQNSFIIIPNAHRNNRPLNADRFCGSAFNVTTSTVRPYVLYVVMGQNKSTISEDEGNRGFKLNFRQLPCRN